MKRLANGTPMRQRVLRYLTRTVPGGPDGRCRVWTGAKRQSRSGTWYGEVSIEGRTVPVHRAVYEYYHGPLPDGVDVHHVCGVSMCIEPAHLQADDAGPHRRRTLKQYQRY